jgi:hypothetical protein
MDVRTALLEGSPSLLVHRAAADLIASQDALIRQLRTELTQCRARVEELLTEANTREESHDHSDP